MATSVTAPSSIKQALRGYKTRPLGMTFAPVWAPTRTKEYVIGDYQGAVRETIGANKTTSHMIRLIEWDAVFIQSQALCEPGLGEVVKVSSSLLDEALKEVTPGTRIGIEFKGRGKDKKDEKGEKTRSGAKLFEVVEITGEAEDTGGAG